MDESRELLRQSIPAKPQAVQHTRPEVGEQDIAALQQAHQHLLALGLFQVQGEAALAPVEQVKTLSEFRVRHVVPTDATHGHLPRQVAVDAIFHLDHIGAHIRQEQCGVGPLDLLAQLDYPDTFQCSRHRFSPPAIPVN